MIVDFTVEGTPTSKGRHRSTVVNGHVRHYPDKRTVTAEAVVAWSYTAAGGVTGHDGPVHLHVECVLPIPVSWPKWKREAAAVGEWPCMCAKDVDNLAKCVLDGLNGLAYLDDRQVVELTARKRYGVTPQTNVRVVLIDAPVKG